ncbi:MAG: cation diffusion facilitator family transporter [Promethearchaeota archaeon]
MKSRKSKLANAAVVYSASLLTIKITIMLLTRSLTVMSETIDVVMDILLIIILKIAIKKSMEPPDIQHTYGHGKYESMGAIVQATVTTIIYCIIMYNAVHAILNDEFDVQPMGFTIYVFIALAISNIIVGVYIIRVGKKEGSDSLKVQGLNYFFDGIRSIIVTISIGLYFSGIKAADAVFALVISVIVIITTLVSCKNAIENLLEKNPLSEEDMREIKTLIGNVREVLGNKDLKAKKVGNIVYVSFTILMDELTPLSDVHEKTEEIERYVQELFPDKHLDLLIHVQDVKR